MGKLVVSLDNVVIKEFQITKERTTLGRRPYNDIVIDNLAVSGEHAVLTAAQSDVFIEDLNSTNGTYINGKAVKKQLLSNNDVVEVGKYRIKFLAEDAEDYEKTMILRPGAFGRAPGVIGTGRWRASILGPSHSTTARSIAFSSSRTLPGQLWARRAASASSEKPSMRLPFSSA